MCPVLVFIAGDLVLAVADQGIPLDHLALVAKGACVPGSHGTVTIGEMGCDRLLPLGHHTDSWLKHTPSLSVKEPTCLSWSFRLRGRLQAWTQVCSGNILWATIFPPSLCLTTHGNLPERSLNTHLEPQFLRMPPGGHLQIVWLMWPVGFMLMVPQDCIY